MTRALFEVLAGVRGGVPIRLLAGILLVALLPLSVLADLLLRVRRTLVIRRTLALTETRCARNHRVVLWVPAGEGGWTCGACGRTAPGHAFETCVCGVTPAFVSCACSLSVDNPIFEELV